MCWFLLITIVAWLTIALLVTALVLCITRNPVNITILAPLAAPAYFLYRILKPMLPMDEKRFTLSKMKIQKFPKIELARNKADKNNVIYQLKNTVSQITCHAAKRVQRIGFSHNLAWHRTSFFFRSPLLSFVRSCNILAKLHEKCAEKCLKMVAFLTPLRYTCYGSEKETRDFSTTQGKTMAGPIQKRALNR